MQFPRPALHIPPTRGWLKITATLHHNVSIAPAFVNVVGELPHATADVLQPIRVRAFRVAADFVELSVARICMPGIDAFNSGDCESLGYNFFLPRYWL